MGHVHGPGRGGESLKADTSVRAVVLSGEGRAFCSGLDFSVFETMKGDGGDAGEAPTTPRIRLVGDRRPARSRTTASRPSTRGPRCRCPSSPRSTAARSAAAPDRARRRHPHRRPRRQDVGARDPLGPHPGHDRHRRCSPASSASTSRRSSPSPAGWSRARRPSRIGLATHARRRPAGRRRSPSPPRSPRKNPDAIRQAQDAARAGRHRSRSRERSSTRSARWASLIGSPNQVEAVTAYFEKRDPTLRRRSTTPLDLVTRRWVAPRGAMTPRDRDEFGLSQPIAAPTRARGSAAPARVPSGSTSMSCAWPKPPVDAVGDVDVVAARARAPRPSPPGRAPRCARVRGRRRPTCRSRCGAAARRAPSAGAPMTRPATAVAQQAGEQLQQDLRLGVAAHRAEDGAQRAVGAGDERGATACAAGAGPARTRRDGRARARSRCRGCAGRCRCPARRRGSRSPTRSTG